MAAVAVAALLSGCGGGASGSGASEGASGAPSAQHLASGGGGGGGQSAAAGAGAAIGGSTAAGAATPAVNGGLGAAVKAPQPDIVRTATIRLRVKGAAAVTATFNRLEGLAAADGGYVASSSLHTGKSPTATLRLRVPADKTGSAVAAVRHYGRVVYATTGGANVTGQVVDTAAEIANLTSEEKAVRGLLAKAGSVRNILTVQQQLFALQGQIQELDAQRNSLANRVQYATLTVDLSTAPPPPAPRPARPDVLTRWWRLASGHTVDVLRSVFLAIGWLAPGFLALAAAGGGWVLWRRRRRAGESPAT